MDQQNDYQFIKVPISLFYLMDANSSKVLTTLIQMDSFYPKTDGYFECAYKTLEIACGLSHPIIKAALAGLYLEGIVDIISVGKGRGKHTNRYKINVERFQDYENTPVGIAIMTEDKPIHQVKYKGERFSVPWNEKRSEKQSEKRSEKKVSTNIDNITNIKNIDNITNIDNIEEYNLNNKEEMDITNKIIEDTENIFKEEERNIIDIDCTYSISKKEEEVEDTYSDTLTETPTPNKEENIEIAKQLFMDFLSNPSQDYSPLRTGINLQYFLQRNHRDLDILQERLRNKCNMYLEGGEVISKLKYFYEEKIGVR